MKTLRESVVMKPGRRGVVEGEDMRSGGRRERIYRRKAGHRCHGKQD